MPTYALNHACLVQMFWCTTLFPNLLEFRRQIHKLIYILRSFLLAQKIGAGRRTVNGIDPKANLMIKLKIQLLVLNCIFVGTFVVLGAVVGNYCSGDLNNGNI